MKLYGYWRSSSSWRVRTALEFKSIPFEYAAVHLVEDGGQQHHADHKERNPMEQVPVLEFEAEGGDLRHITQSIAIMEFIEETHPEPALLPSDPFLRAKTRQLAEVVNAGIQPLQNLDLLLRLKADFDVDPRRWCAPYIRDGLVAYEAMMMALPGEFSVGDTPTIADICLIPQLYNARRFDVELDDLPGLLALEQRCMELAAFKASHPDNQPDAQ
ncbi:MAG: maleylacetoacetate isomerase [Myxococcota bacterium]